MARELAKSLREIETKRKTESLEEWQELIEKAGLANLSSEQIDRAVARGVRRPKKLNAWPS